MRGGVYIKFSGGIEGDSTVSGHEGSLVAEWAEFKVLQPALEMGARGVLDQTGAVGQAGCTSSPGRSQLSEISLGRAMDASSADLFMLCCLGTRLESVKITFVGTYGPTLNVPYAVIELGNVFVSKYSSTLYSDQPWEDFAISYATIKMTTIKGAVSKTKGFDVVKNRALPN